MSETGKSRESSDGSIDVLIITAAEGEDEAVRAAGGMKESWKRVEGPPESVLDVWRADLPWAPHVGRPLRVALSRSFQMGAEAATHAAAILTQHFRPACLAMCGVCAGRPDWTEFGDVIIADRVYRYDTGELVNATVGGVPQFNADMLTYPFPAMWKQPAERWTPAPSDQAWLATRPPTLARQGEWVLRELHAGRDPSASPERPACCPEWTKLVQALRQDGLIEIVEAGGAGLTAAGKKRAAELLFDHPDGIPPALPFRVHVGPLGTGSNLIRDVDVWKKLGSDQRMLRGFDMEASVIGFTAMMQGMQWIVVKGVMDFGEPGRGQGFRRFAARAAAEVLLSFLRDNLSPAEGARRPGDYGRGPQHGPDADEIPTATPDEPAASVRTKCFDSDQMWAVTVEAATAPVSGVVIAAHGDTRWAWDIFPTMFHLRTNGFPVRVILEPARSTDDKAGRQELFRRRLLELLGVEVVQVARIDDTAIFLDYARPEMTCAVVTTRRTSEYSPLAVVYRGRTQRPVIEALYGRVAGNEGQIPTQPAPALIAADAARICERLKAGVPQYEASGVHLQLQSLPMSELFSIVRSVRELKVRQAQRFLELFERAKLVAWEPAAVRLIDGSLSYVTPPVVERVNGKLVLVEGNTRAAVAFRCGVTDIPCILVEGVRAPLPGEPVSMTEVRLARKKLLPEDRIQRWDYDLFRPIERAVHPY